jgi:glycerol uptake facilitator-like aquaporin/protein-tyrosine-phosphatase
MAEAILNHKAKGQMTAYSAGSHPSGAVRREALKQLELAGISTDGLRSKSWDEFADSPPMNFVFTVCDNAANEACPFWPGQPMNQPLSFSSTLHSGEAGDSEGDREHRQTMKTTLARRVVAEFFGTLLLLAAVVGSGIMGERLAGGNIAIALLANTLATGAALVAIILAFGPVSGAHLNPAVTLADAWMGGIAWRETPLYILAQVAGAVAGVVAAHVMFGLPLISASTHVRSGSAQLFSEFIATFGLLAVIWGCVRRRPQAVPFAVGAYITAAYWFTASTSFANPAVTLARCLTNTFAGIRPYDVAPFIVAQLAGAFAATMLFRWLVPSIEIAAADVLVKHEQE